MLVNDIDPVQAKQEAREEILNRATNVFENVAYEWLDIHSGKASAYTIKRYTSMLSTYIFPYLGKRPIADLKAPDFLQVLRKIEAQGTYFTTKRTRTICGMVMRYAVATGRAEFDPISSLRGAFKSYTPKHLASTVVPKDVARILRLIKLYQGSLILSTALKISPYVFVRPGELRSAKWKDINFETCEWHYTATKTKTPHIVPLAPQVINLLRELEELTSGGEYLFPNRDNKNAPMGNTALIRAIKDAGIKREEMTKSLNLETHP